MQCLLVASWKARWSIVICHWLCLLILIQIFKRKISPTLQPTHDSASHAGDANVQNVCPATAAADTDDVTVNRHLTETRPKYDHDEIGFIWSWNFMISKRWKQVRCAWSSSGGNEGWLAFNWPKGYLRTDNTSKGEVSLYGWSPVLFVQIQLIWLHRIRNIFTCVVKSKEEVSHTLILPLTK